MNMNKPVQKAIYCHNLSTTTKHLGLRQIHSDIFPPTIMAVSSNISFINEIGTHIWMRLAFQIMLQFLGPNMAWLGTVALR